MNIKGIIINEEIINIILKSLMLNLATALYFVIFTSFTTNNIYIITVLLFLCGIFSGIITINALNDFVEANDIDL